MIKKTKDNKLQKMLGYTALWVMLLVVIIAISVVLIIKNNNSSPENIIDNLKNTDQDVEIKTFQSEEDFKTYLALVEEEAPMGFSGGIAVTRDSAVSNAPEVFGMGEADMKTITQRVSDTNVQVFNIDEPDIVKTDGQEIYFSLTSLYRPFVDTVSVGIEKMPYFDQETMVHLMSAWPVDNLDLDSTIDKSGNLLLTDNTLVIFDDQNVIYGYDVSSKKTPEQKWNIALEDNTYLTTARLYNDKIYLVLATNINTFSPCPLEPVMFNEKSLSIACNEIYHPSAPIWVDSNFTVLQIDPQTGELIDRVSFLGATGSSVVYMSENSLYLTYNHSVNQLSFLIDFIQSKATDLIPREIISKLNKINDYDISSRSKMLEYETIVSDWMASLNKDDRLKMENELQNRMVDYFKANQRSMMQTEIVKIDLDKFDVSANGKVPGTPLNQFSLDEYDGYLRIATTIGGFNNNFGSISSESVNDVYVLDNELNIKGSVQDLGLGERIYSTRFIGDKAYVVTFKQTDPFYILDLSDPNSPQKRGELKIPGYSSYLHPISENRILGIGQEGSQLKLSYFDVADMDNPQEIAKYTLDEYYSESLYDHHAFLQDAEHEIFFIPGNEGAYIFSYADDQLDLVKALSENNVKRALYINNYLYILGLDSITILDENTWGSVNKFRFGVDR